MTMNTPNLNQATPTKPTRHRNRRAPHQGRIAPSVMWVGISDKPSTEPLATSTATGKVVDEIERELTGLSFHRTNLVKFAPLDKTGRLRYPTREEMAQGTDSLLEEVEELQPRVVVTLGAAVSKVVIERVSQESRFTGLGNSFSYAPRSTSRFCVLPVHHPSFVLVYRRKKLQSYIAAICKWIMEIIAHFESRIPGTGRRKLNPA